MIGWGGAGRGLPSLYQEKKTTVQVTTGHMMRFRLVSSEVTGHDRRHSDWLTGRSDDTEKRFRSVS